MIKAEIRTDAGNYIVNIEAKTLREAWEIVDDTIKAGMPFEGDEFLVIGPGASIKHIRIFEAYDDIPFMQPEEVGLPAPPTGPYIFTTDRCEFLGHKIVIKGQAIEKDGHTWYLPMEVNDEPALERLSAEKLEEFLVYWNMSKGETYNSFTVVVPPAQLPDYEEALEYLKDYVEETTPAYEPIDKNAKAWQGWKERG